MRDRAFDARRSVEELGQQARSIKEVMADPRLTDEERGHLSNALADTHRMASEDLDEYNDDLEAAIEAAEGEEPER